MIEDRTGFEDEDDVEVLKVHIRKLEEQLAKKPSMFQISSHCFSCFALGFSIASLIATLLK